ncbi:hypothetical protein [Paenibacillus hexagrammi]|uniref:Uncharacterized protein n=1 Tax=Paenibacillus hexagrammi TaxID=2908839 RepID=A0ABY3SLK2_9BACL|nr:hypothetical protein [Paenibacillus sp. YPD9-1]UJF34942.1 hypothetical protein L0M14_07295 [Paenibacillus sp. YPD9-1]
MSEQQSLEPHDLAEQLSNETNTPSTSAMENNDNDLHLKADKSAFGETSADSPMELEPGSDSELENAEEPAWFDSVRGAAMIARDSFPDQIDYYEPDLDETI